MVRNTLGVARYRAGDYRGAVADLEKSVKLRGGGDSIDFFFLAMAHWRLGHTDQARTWYADATAWMDRRAADNPELLRFRTEAGALLGVPAPTTRPTTAAASPAR